MTPPDAPSFCQTTAWFERLAFPCSSYPRGEHMAAGCVGVLRGCVVLLWRVFLQFPFRDWQPVSKFEYFAALLCKSDLVTASVVWVRQSVSVGFAV